MKVSRDHLAYETATRTTSAVFPLTSLSRASFACMLLAMLPTHAKNSEQPARDGTAVVAQTDVWESSNMTHIDDIPPNGFLIGRRIIVPATYEGGPDIVVRIERGPAGLVIDVDGKQYGVSDCPMIPNVTLGKVIDDARLENGVVTLYSREYGTATVSMEEVRGIVGRLSASESPTVETWITADFRAKEGTLLCASLSAAKEMNKARKHLLSWIGGDAAKPEAEQPGTYELTFVRMDSTTLAANR